MSYVPTRKTRNPSRVSRKNTGFGDITRERARRIVKLAAKGSRLSSVKSWLTLDERGTWEKTALDWLNNEQLQANAATQGVSEREVDEGVALVLRMNATDALLRDAKKRVR